MILKFNILFTSLYYSRHLDELWYEEFTNKSIFSFNDIIKFMDYFMSFLDKELRTNNFVTLLIYINDDFEDFKIPNLDDGTLYNDMYTPPEICITTKNRSMNDLIHNSEVELYSKPIKKENLKFSHDYKINYNCWRTKDALENNDEYSKYFSINFFFE